MRPWPASAGFFYCPTVKRSPKGWNSRPFQKKGLFSHIRNRLSRLMFFDPQKPLRKIKKRYTHSIYLLGPAFRFRFNGLRSSGLQFTNMTPKIPPLPGNPPRLGSPHPSRHPAAPRFPLAPPYPQDVDARRAFASLRPSREAGRPESFSRRGGCVQIRRGFSCFFC